MTHSVNTVWKNNMAFDSQIDNHVLRMDTSGESGEGSGPSPKKLLLASLAGCTGMDVVGMLKKMRVSFTGFEMAIDADLTQEHPKVYSEIRLIYRFFGKELSKEKINKAVNLSKEKYCGVSAMLGKACPIIHSIEIIEE